MNQRWTEAMIEMEDIIWKESVGKRFLTRVTETGPRVGDGIVVYMREIKIKKSTNDGEQVEISFPNIVHVLEWADTMTKTLRVALSDGGVQTYEVISETTPETDSDTEED